MKTQFLKNGLLLLLSARLFTKHNIVLLFIGLFTQNAIAQEVFGDNLGEYNKNTQVYNMYTLENMNSADYKHKNDNSYSLNMPKTVGTAPDRFGIAGQALLFTSDADYATIPAKVVNDVIDAGKGISLSFWMKSDDYKVARQIFNIKDNAGKIITSLRLTKDGYFQILKYSTYAGKMAIYAQTRYKISLNDISPSDQEYGLGHIFVSITSDKFATRIFYSRPGGKLYANYFWFGLMDIIKKDSKITFGTETPDGKAINRLDDIMIYREVLTPEVVSNHFLLQSPLYPSRSYLVKNYQDKVLNIDHTDYKAGYSDNYIKTLPAINEDNGIYSFGRWFIPSISISSNGNLKRFFNAKTMGRISRWNANSGNYYYQVSGDGMGEKDQFDNWHIANRFDNLLDPSIASYNFPSYEYRDKKYQLGVYNDFLYLQDANKADDEWKVTGAFTSSVRENFSTVSDKQKVSIMNYKSKLYMGIYSGPENYYLIESKSPTSFFLNKNTAVLDPKSISYNYSDYIISNTDFPKGPFYLNAYGGPTDTKDNGYVSLSNSVKSFNWQLVYVKDDPNGKPLYIIRTNNSYGARVLIPNYETGGNTYITQNMIQETGDFPDRCLWSVNVTY